MGYVVYGAGAVGGVIGARLHLAGIETTLVARGAHLARIRSDGLVLDTGGGRRVAWSAATDTAADVDWSSNPVVLLCVKAHQTAAALRDLATHAPGSTRVVCAQNGVTNEAETLRLFEHAYALCVMLPSWHGEPGVVVEKCAPTPGILDVGRFPAGLDKTTESVATDLRAAGFESVPRADVMAWKYRKLVVNAVGDVSAVLGHGDEAAALRRVVRKEGEAVLAAAGIAVVTADEDDQRRGDVLRPREDVEAYAGNSLLQSLRRGLDSEIDYRAGEIVLLGRLHGVPTPANELVRQTCLDRARDGGEPGSIDATGLLEDPG